MESTLPKKIKLSSSDSPMLEVSEASVQDAETVSEKPSETPTRAPDLTFKEQPYHFVSPDEPALQSCMYVYFRTSDGHNL